MVQNQKETKSNSKNTSRGATIKQHIFKYLIAIALIYPISLIVKELLWTQFASVLDVTDYELPVYLLSFAIGLYVAKFVLKLNKGKGNTVNPSIMNEKGDKVQYDTIDVEWDDSIKETLSKYDQYRKKIIKNIFMYLGIIILSLGAIIGILLLTSDAESLFADIRIVMALPPLIFAALVAGGLIFLINKKRYHDNFHKEVIPKIVGNQITDMTYSRKSYVSKNDFLESNLFNYKNYYRYTGEDYIKGKLEDQQVEFSNLHVYKRNKNDHDITLFAGLFAVAQFPKPIKGSIVILPDTAENVFGSTFGNFLQERFSYFSRNGYELVRLENPEFEKHLVVYATDQVEARYVLSTSLMERITNFYNKISGYRMLKLAINQDKLYIAIHDYTGSGKFIDPSLFGGSCQHPYLYRELILDVNLVRDTLKTIYHNAEIWQTKNKVNA